MENIKGHQGDVQFAAIQSIPDGAIKTPNKPLAVSDTSGHAHIITGNVQRYELQDRVFFELIEDSVLQHVDSRNIPENAWTSTTVLPIKDHNPHTLPKGIYEFWIQKAYNPYTKLMEKVVD